MPALLARHNEILNQTIQLCGRFVVQIVGDSFRETFHPVARTGRQVSGVPVRAFVFSLHLYHLPHALDSPLFAIIIQNNIKPIALELIGASHFTFMYICFCCEANRISWERHV
jgi:hypothetical protein